MFLIFRVLGFANFNWSGAFWIARCWLRQADAKTAWCTSAQIWIAMKENMAVSFYRPNYEPFIVSCVGNLTSWDSYINCMISSFASYHSYHLLTHYFAQRSKKNLAPNKRTDFYLQNEEIFKMEDRLHIHQTWAKQWLNDRQYLIPLGTHGHPK